MSTGWLFGMGLLVMVIVAIGIALPIYGAILDGRDQAEQQLRNVRQLPDKRADRRPAA
jgi:hypothetical protein